MLDLAVIFTGHMIDLPGRDRPRFPPVMESVVADVIKMTIGELSERTEGSLVGIASGARGSDILFLEIVQDLGLETRMVLPLPPEQFIPASVAGVASGDWEDRFQALWNRHGDDEREVIAIGTGRERYVACNSRMVALGRSLAKSTVLLAYWDGASGDGTGGTQSFVDMMRTAGGEVLHLDAAELYRNFLSAGLGQ